MTQHEFDILSEKYSKGNCSPEEIALLEKWADLHFRQHESYNAFQDQAEVQGIEKRLWKRIQSSAGIFHKNRIRLISRWLWKSVAACLTLVLISYFIFVDRTPLQQADLPVTGIETKNTANTRQRVILPDSSAVILEAGASIIASENYGKQTRAVYLTGEAFFDIKPNMQMPFLVYADELVTEVLGTSFRIKHQGDNKTIEVSVVTGKVSVYAENSKQNKKRNGVIIAPNQKVVYDTESKTIRQDLVDIPKMIVSDLSRFDFLFEETAVERVLSFVQNVYGVEIVVGNPVLNHCAFTGDLNGLDMYRQLDFICEVINAQYEIRGTTIFITGNGCKGSI